MVTLVKYEFMKIIKKRTAIIAIIVSILLALLSSVSMIKNEKAYDNQGFEYRGVKAIALQKNQYKQISGYLTEERVKELIKNYQNLLKDNKSPNISTAYLSDKAYWNYFNPKAQLYFLISNTYDKSNMRSNLKNLSSISLSDGAQFYKTRNEKIEQLLNLKSLDRNYTSEEKNFWIQKNLDIKVPYEYGFFKGWNSIMAFIGFWVLPILAICISVSPVFSGEYQSGADSIILSSKLGKTKVILAKIISSLLFSTAVFMLFSLIVCGLILALYGVDGWNLPCQIMNIIFPYPLNFLESTLLHIGVAYIVMIGLVSITLVFSSYMKSSFPVLVVDIFLIFFPNFLSLSENNGLFNQGICLTPIWAIEKSTAYYTSYQFGKVIISLPLMIFIVYTILSICFLFISYKAFKNHQVL